ncbi:phage tail assembly chaperone [Pseudogemmobacter faecipullorum]|uniref:Phage tail assembly chaperone n=1 Tax=Pseudogemmobacter faecipullorum TaxID=2755041 RepID=A0ABS8CKV7_9RHOB|nr:phage tail assembly chaperone [Pseudogemmobacter faecipullorum]MCB5410016.1 phage tail assembly chaperone [Pseudogemmobacter faecipullorum]
MNSRFDWPGLMRAGIGGLKLEPGRFWALTPVELRLMLGLEPGPPPLSRARLAELDAALAKAKEQKDERDCRDRACRDRGADHQPGAAAGQL